MTIEISKWAKIAAEAVRTINPSIAPEEWIQIAINDACQEKDRMNERLAKEIVLLERHLEDAKAVLEKMPHTYIWADSTYYCHKDCPRCAYERLKASHE